MKVTVNQQILEAKILIPEAKLRARIGELAQSLNEDLGEDEPLLVLIVLNGALIFAADLMRGLKMPTEIETVRVSSYEGMKSTGKLNFLTPLPDMAGRNVLVVEDIVDTGRTVRHIIQSIQAMAPKRLLVCALLDKPSEHEAPIKIDYTGFEIGKNFVIGFGLDLDGKFRNLPYVAELVPAK